MWKLNQQIQPTPRIKIYQLQFTCLNWKNSSRYNTDRKPVIKKYEADEGHTNQRAKSRLPSVCWHIVDQIQEYRVVVEHGNIEFVTESSHSDWKILQKVKWPEIIACDVVGNFVLQAFKKQKTISKAFDFAT